MSDEHFPEEQLQAAIEGMRELAEKPALNPGDWRGVEPQLIALEEATPQSHLDSLPLPRSAELATRLQAIIDRVNAGWKLIPNPVTAGPPSHEAAIRQWCQNACYKDTCLLVERLRLGLPDSTIAYVLKALDGICKDCWAYWADAGQGREREGE